jgi:hypothetical protein
MAEDQAVLPEKENQVVQLKTQAEDQVALREKENPADQQLREKVLAVLQVKEEADHREVKTNN